MRVNELARRADRAVGPYRNRSRLKSAAHCISDTPLSGGRGNVKKNSANYGDHHQATSNCESTWGLQIKWVKRNSSSLIENRSIATGFNTENKIDVYGEKTKVDQSD